MVRAMLAGYSRNFTPADVQMTRQKLIKGRARDFESLDLMLRSLHPILHFGKGMDYIEQEQQMLFAMELADYRQIANKYLNEDRMIYLVVGDRASQLEGVKAFAKGEVVELDIYGNPLGERADG